LLIGPNVHETAQEGPGGHHDSFGMELDLQGSLDPINTTLSMEQAERLTLFAV
jgi:hypothetical protein